MISDLDSLLYKAEAEYLSQQDLADFKSQIGSLEKRLQIYEALADKEIEIFQYVADRAVEKFPDESETKIARALKHWLAVMRYCAMAMLFDNPNYLQHHVLEWLPEQVAAHHLKDLEQDIYSLMQSRLKKSLKPEHFAVLNPYLEQSRLALLK